MKVTLENEGIEKLIEKLNTPKLELGFSEKRSVAQYESKEYTIRAWIPYDKLPSQDEMNRIFDELRAVLHEQQKKDGIKPLRAKQPTEKKASSPSSSSSEHAPSSIIQKAFEKAESGKDAGK